MTSSSSASIKDKDPLQESHSSMDSSATATTASSTSTSSEDEDAFASLTFTANRFATKRKRGVRFQDHYTLGKLLGKGGFGRVFSCTHKTSRQERACKMIAKSKNTKAVLQEFKLLSELDHPNLIHVYELFEDKKYYCIVTEQCTGGDLYDWLQTHGPLSESQVAIVIQRLLSAIHFCHANNLVHRDLKPENVLLQDSGDFSTLKIIDFGLARHDRGKAFKSIVGSPFYVSPQVVGGHYHRGCDIWAIGTIAYILLSGRPPFEAPTDAEVLEKIQIGWVHFDLEAFDKVSDECTGFLRLLLTFDEADRPTAEQALKHPWLQTQLQAVNAKSTVHDLILERDIQNALQAMQRFQSKDCKLKQATASLVARHHHTGLRRERTDAVFRALDRNCHGTLSVHDLQIAYADYLDVFYSPHQIQQQLMPHINYSGSGAVQYSELAAIISLEGRNSLEQVQAVYQSLDTDSKGYLTVQDLQNGLKLDAATADSVSCQVLAQVSDKDTISKEAFEQAMDKSSGVESKPAPVKKAALGAPEKRKSSLRRSRSMVAGAA